MSQQAIRPAIVRTPSYPFEHVEAQYKQDQNENPYDFPRDLKTKVLERLMHTPFNRYPDLYAETLAEKIAQYENWDKNGVVITPGSNVLIHQLVSIAGLGQKVLFAKPNFAVYSLEAQHLEAEMLGISLNPDFSMDAPAMIAELQKPESKGIVFLCVPHAPTGFLDSPETVRNIVDSAGENWLVVLDEAYHQYAGSDYRELVKGHPTRVILRTFSKAWGLAGVRLGYALTSPETAAHLRKVLSAFNVNILSTVVAEVALEHPEYVHSAVQEAITERERVFAAVQAHPTWQPFPSHSNFILFRTLNSKEAYQKLLQYGILVRKQDTGYMLENCLRYSIGTPEQNDAFIAAMAHIQTKEKCL